MASSPTQEMTSISLHHAMKVADTIRKEYTNDGEKKTESKSFFPPGLVQGLSACVVTGVALVPLRRVILHQSSNHLAFRNFVDLVISVGHALAATQVGFLAGSVYGSNFYLQELAKVPPTTESPVVDRICNTMWSEILPTSIPQTTIDRNMAAATSWDPRVSTMASLQLTIENCRRRKEVRELPS